MIFGNQTLSNSIHDNYESQLEEFKNKITNYIVPENHRPIVQDIGAHIKSFKNIWDFGSGFKDGSVAIFGNFSKIVQCN